MECWGKKDFVSGAYVGQNTFCLKIVNGKYLINGGERGIRTLDSVATIHAFQALRLEKN